MCIASKHGGKLSTDIILFCRGCVTYYNTIRTYIKKDNTVCNKNMLGRRNTFPVRTLCMSRILNKYQITKNRI